MQMKLIENNGDYITEFRFSWKEIYSTAFIYTFKVAKEIYKENSRYIYFRIKGDFLNKRQLD